MIIYKVHVKPQNNFFVYENIHIALEDVKCLLMGSIPKTVIVETCEMTEDYYKNLPKLDKS